MAKPDKHEVDFHKMLQILATHCHFQLNEMTISLYDRALSIYGYEEVTNALMEIFNTRRGGDRFPSVAEIKEKMGLEVSGRSLAVDCANLIFSVFNKWRDNYTSRPEFEDHFRKTIGDLPWEVLQRMGGYRVLYKEWNECSDLAILRAQVRDAAQAVIELTKANKLNEPLRVESRSPKQIGGKSES